ncbi:MULTISPECIES: hypothetical protein [unclassified Candidatus Frackibacter]|uniref:hypothetical protein n=1 Tax=unclassified Candidatus Frackibacter TaxID=2648818 RepID=UPI000886F4D4|nr:MULTISPECIES: hypothetical protein [unclassified Candidatus Frackibacter]SDC00519.1 hypothetical protein SAMN04515661_101243 [Candidatus Frackibacter sp. WG11]SEM31968.1 hypothetical protein SAMN04488698_101243 [Candidatus Frackibacter sp. WG12]SFL36867.1 hypothetical protein SAMN04488699_101243 [Candidatus Frackibacter sp. WG13]
MSVKIIISSELKNYAQKKDLALIIREQKINSCCGGKLTSVSTQGAKTPPQVIKGRPAKENLADYKELTKSNIILYIHHEIMDSHTKLELDIKRFLGIIRFIVEGS